MSLIGGGEALVTTRQVPQFEDAAAASSVSVAFHAAQAALIHLFC